MEITIDCHHPEFEFFRKRNVERIRFTFLKEDIRGYKPYLSLKTIAISLNDEDEFSLISLKQSYPKLANTIKKIVYEINSGLHGYLAKGDYHFHVFLSVKMDYFSLTNMEANP
jgi:hypothetical protein